MIVDKIKVIGYAKALNSSQCGTVEKGEILVFYSDKWLGNKNQAGCIDPETKKECLKGVRLKRFRPTKKKQGINTGESHD